MKYFKTIISILILLLLSSNVIDAKTRKRKSLYKQTKVDEISEDDKKIIESKETRKIIFNPTYFLDYIAGVLSAWFSSIGSIRDAIRTQFSEEHSECSIKALYELYKTKVQEMNTYYGSIIKGDNIRKTEENESVQTALERCEEGKKEEIAQLEKNQTELIFQISTLKAKTDDEKIKHLKDNLNISKNNRKEMKRQLKQELKKLKELKKSKEPQELQMQKSKKAIEELNNIISSLKQKELDLHLEIKEIRKQKKNKSESKKLIEEIEELEEKMKDNEKIIREIRKIKCKKAINKKNKEYSISIIKRARFFLGFVKETVTCVQKSPIFQGSKVMISLVKDIVNVVQKGVSVFVNTMSFGALGIAKGLINVGIIIYYAIKAVKQYKLKNLSNYAFYIGKVQGNAVKTVISLLSGMRRRKL